VDEVVDNAVAVGEQPEEGGCYETQNARRG
jgi:hypothetical protein